jgi:hypothetical protein
MLLSHPQQDTCALGWQGWVCILTALGVPESGLKSGLHKKMKK